MESSALLSLRRSNIFIFPEVNVTTTGLENYLKIKPLLHNCLGWCRFHQDIDCQSVLIALRKTSSFRICGLQNEYALSLRVMTFNIVCQSYTL